MVESAQNKDMDIYIDDEPVSDEFNIKGIDLDKYNRRCVVMLDVLCIIMALLIVAIIFLIGILCFIIAIQEKRYPFILPSIAAFTLGVFLIVICPLNSSSPLNAADDLKNRAIEAYKDGDKIYINGSPVEDGFDLNGVDLDKYDIKIKNDTVYLMSK